MNIIANLQPDFICGAFIILCCGVAIESFQTLVNLLVIVFSIVSIYLII
mgnify:CR=1 FL=1